MGAYLPIFMLMEKCLMKCCLEQGLARVAYIYAPNTQYVDEFYAIQKKAQKKGVGIWSIENYAQEDGYNTDNVNKPKDNKYKFKSILQGTTIKITQVMIKKQT